MDAHQNLPFAEAEAAAIDRRTTLLMAVAAAGGDLHLRVFLEMVLEHDQSDAALVASYGELSRTPYGLCCSPRSAERVVRRARELGLVRVEQQFDGAAQRANGYRVDWGGVGRVLRGEGQGQGRSTADGDRFGGDRRRKWRPHPGLAGDDPGLAGDDPGLAGDDPGLAGDGGSIARAPARAGSGVLLLNSSGPDPDPDPEPEVLIQSQKLPAAIASIAELAAATRTLLPLPAGSLRLGVFRPLRLTHLENTLQLVEWFRRQLDAHAPVLGDSEAELLLTIAAARHALDLADERVKVNRVACFCATISRGKWLRVLSYLPEARRRLDSAHAFALERKILLPWFAEVL